MIIKLKLHSIPKTSWINNDHTEIVRLLWYNGYDAYSTQQEVGDMIERILYSTLLIPAYWKAKHDTIF